jgi:hypothetical protein
MYTIIAIMDAFGCGAQIFMSVLEVPPELAGKLLEVHKQHVYYTFGLDLNI